MSFPQLKSREEPVEPILEAIQTTGYKPGMDIAIVLDPAASEFFSEGSYVFAKSDKRMKTPAERIALWGSEANWDSRRGMGAPRFTNTGKGL